MHALLCYVADCDVFLSAHAAVPLLVHNGNHWTQAALALAEAQRVKVQALELEVVAREKRLSDFEVISNRQRGASRDLGTCVYHVST
jgi:hypothetical protein